MHRKFKQLTVSSVHPLQDFGDLSEVCEFSITFVLSSADAGSTTPCMPSSHLLNGNLLNTISILGR